MEKVLAICLKTYPNEDDMWECMEGNIEPCDVKIYYKGEKYLVVAQSANKEYYKIVDNDNEAFNKEVELIGRFKASKEEAKKIVDVMEYKHPVIGQSITGEKIITRNQ